MSKRKELLNFQWQKNQNEFIFAVTLLLALFSIKNEFNGIYKLVVYLIFPILIFFAGWGLIRLTFSENEYLEELRDKRIKISILSKIKSISLIIISIMIGIGIVYLAMNIWKEFFLKVFGK